MAMFRHSRSGQIRCPICAPLRCKLAGKVHKVPVKAGAALYMADVPVPPKPLGPTCRCSEPWVTIEHPTTCKVCGGAVPADDVTP